MSSRSSHLEVEAKFRVPEPFTMPPLDTSSPVVSSVEGPRYLELRAVYWDTADLRLAREGITLRCRTGEGAADGWHLKVPSGERARLELSVAGDDGAPPGTLTELVTAYTRRATLAPVATLLTTRSSWLLRGPEGEPLAEVTDDTVHVVGADAVRLREVEVEDKGGGVGLLDRVGRTLRSAGATPAPFLPKLVQALGERATGQPDVPPPGQADRSGNAAAALAFVLRGYVRQFLAADASLRARGDDAVHQMRVSARRIRSALRAFRPLVDREWAEALRAELSWVAGSLGDARDSEVLLARLLDDVARLPVEQVIGPVRARLEEELRGRHAAAGEAVGETLRSERYLDLLERLVDAARAPRTTAAAEAGAAESLPPLLARAYRRMRRAAAGVSGMPGAPDASWHEARIAAKRLRYTAEALAPFLGKRAAKLARRAEDVQELLGEQQDAVVARATLRGLATRPEGAEAAFTLGILFARQETVVAQCRRRFPKAWRRLVRSAAAAAL